MANTVTQDPAATAADQAAQAGPTGHDGDRGEVLLPDSYEAAVSELEQLVARMEGGALSLEDSLAAYRRGAALVAYCQQQLEKVEQQVRVLDGETLKPLPAGASPADCGDDL